MLIRHGETDANQAGILIGHTDPPLNRRGQAQAREMALLIRAAGAPDAIWASDLKRAHETATLIAGKMGLVANVDRDLREASLGIMDGKPADSDGIQIYIEAREKDLLKHRPPAGESHVDVAVRLKRFLNTHKAKLEGRKTLIIGHAGTIRAFCHLLCGAGSDHIDFKQAPLGKSIINFDAGEAKWGMEDI